MKKTTSPQIILIFLLLLLFSSNTGNVSTSFAQGTPKFLKLPFYNDPAMNVQQGWIYTWNNVQHSSIDFSKGPIDQMQQSFDVLAAADGDACLFTTITPGQDYVRIKHNTSGGVYYTGYAHLDPADTWLPICPSTTYVTAGTKIGIAGEKDTGGCASPCIHLHFEVIQGDPWVHSNRVDPYDIEGYRWEYPDPSSTNGKVAGSNHLWLTNPPTGFVVDTTPPNISFTTPTEDRWYNTNQTLEWTISDPESGIERYEWWWNNGSHNLVNKTGNPTAAGGSTSLSSAGQGQHTLHIKAWNGAGLSFQKSKSWFGYDTVAPTLPTTATPNCTATHNVWQKVCNDPDFSWTKASDTTSGTAIYQIYWGTNSNGTTVTASRTSPTYDPPAVSAGTRYLRVRAKDNAGNWSGWQTLFTLRYDNINPTGSFNFSSGGLSYTVNPLLNLNGIDSHSGVSKVLLSNDGSNYTEKDYASEVNWKIPASDGHTQTVYVQFKDEAGNVSGIYQQQVCLDMTPVMPSSANYRLWSAGSIAGSDYASNNYRMHHTEGQPFTRNPQTSANYQLHSGFQATWPASPGTGPFTANGCATAFGGNPGSSGADVFLPIIIKNQ